MIVFALFALVGCAALVGIGVVAGAVVAMLTAVGLTAGVISTSTLVGLQRRSLTAAFRAAVYQVAGIGGCAVGVAAGVAIAFIWNDGRAAAVIPSGGVAGTVGGLLLGRLFNAACSHLVAFTQHWTGAPPS